MRKLSILFIIFLCPSLAVVAQLTEQWAMRYSFSSGTDKPYAMAVDKDGNVYVTGSSQTAGAGTEDYLTVKYNGGGTELWTRRYNGIGNGVDIAHAIAVDSAGYIYVTGESSVANGTRDFLTIKYTPAGDTLWTARYNGTKDANDIAYAITVSDSGYVYICGSSEGTVGTHGIFEDYATVKYDAAGAQVWAMRYDGPGGDYDAAYSIAADAQGSVYVTGESGGGSDNSSMPYQDYATIKYHASGAMLWVKRYNGELTNSDDRAAMLKLDSAGNVYVTGKSEGTASAHDYLTIKYTTAGDTVWTARYNGTGNGADAPAALAVDNSGNAYITGISYRGTVNGNDMLTIRYGPFGNQVWAVPYSGPAGGSDGATAIVLDAMSNVYITGYGVSSSTAADYITMQYDQFGTLKWTGKYANGNAAGSSEVPAALWVDKIGSIYVTGMSALDYATVKYSEPTLLSAIPASVAKLSYCYPNPATSQLTIVFNLANEQPVSIALYDLNGREVALLSKREIYPAGIHSLTHDVSGFPKGLYFYRITAGASTETGKWALTE